MESLPELEGDFTMSTTTTPLNSLAIAIDLERKGRDFYRALAHSAVDPKFRDFCTKAAQEESCHLTVLQQLHQDLLMLSGGTSDVVDLDSTVPGTEQPTQSDPTITRPLVLPQNPQDALRAAAALEEGVIPFYEQLQEELPGLTEILQAIMSEEKKRLCVLLAAIF
jgi:rubrerythrin